MNHLLKQQDSLSADATKRLSMSLDSLMINLSPIDADFITKICEEKTGELLKLDNHLKGLLVKARELVRDNESLTKDCNQKSNGDTIGQFVFFQTLLQVSIAGSQLACQIPAASALRIPECGPAFLGCRKNFDRIYKMNRM